MWKTLCNGNDSGIDTGATKVIQLQCAFTSCNSSSVSVCSDSHESKTHFMDCKRGIDCETSESESSSLSTERQRVRQSPPKNRSRLSAETNETNGGKKNRIRAASTNRLVNQRSYGAPILPERARSRDRQQTLNLLSPKKRLKATLSLHGKSEHVENENSQKKSSILKRTSSVSRRTLEIEDGRWPSNQFRSMTNVQGRNKNEMLVIKSKVGPRKKEIRSEEDLSSSIESTIVRRQSTRGSTQRDQKIISKTFINHAALVNLHKQQIDTRDKEIQELKEMIEAMDAENKTLRLKLTEKFQSLTLVESDNPLIFESQIQHSHLEEKKSEIFKLREFCDQLQVDMNRSVQSMLKEKINFEKETLELQDFLQDEKAVISDALRDAENEIECLVEKLKQKEREIDRLEDECRHLVRISEQRRSFI